MTIVSLGTSLPELAIGLNAAQQGSGGLAVGNIIGTNLVNILLILGLSALIRPVPLEQRTLRFDLPAMTAAAILLFVLGRDGDLSTADGIVLCGYGVGYLILMAVLARLESRSDATVGRASPEAPAAPADGQQLPNRHAAIQSLLLLVGLAVIVVDRSISWTARSPSPATSAPVTP